MTARTHSESKKSTTRSVAGNDHSPKKNSPVSFSALNIPAAANTGIMQFVRMGRLTAIVTDGWYDYNEGGALYTLRVDNNSVRSSALAGRGSANPALPLAARDELLTAAGLPLPPTATPTPALPSASVVASSTSTGAGTMGGSGASGFMFPPPMSGMPMGMGGGMMGGMAMGGGMMMMGGMGMGFPYGYGFPYGQPMKMPHYPPPVHTTGKMAPPAGMGYAPMGAMGGGGGAPPAHAYAPPMHAPAPPPAAAARITPAFMARFTPRAALTGDAIRQFPVRDGTVAVAWHHILMHLYSCITDAELAGKPSHSFWPHGTTQATLEADLQAAINATVRSGVSQTINVHGINARIVWQTVSGSDRVSTFYPELNAGDNDYLTAAEVAEVVRQGIP